VADTTHQAYHANQHVSLLLSCSSGVDAFINSTKKQIAFERKFRMCERVVPKWHAFSQIAPPPPIKKQVCSGNQRMLAELLL
jgi:hypothetical protein